MARIAIILGRLVIGGTTMDTLQVAQYLQSDHEVLLITGYGEKGEFEAAYLTSHLPRVKQLRIDGFSGSIHLWRDWKALLKIRRALRKFNPDIVHTHTAKAGLIGRLAAFAEKVPVVVHTYHGLIFHSYYSARVSRWVVKMERWLAGHTTCVIALSHTQRRQIVEDYKICSAEKVAVLALGINLHAFQQNREPLRRAFREKYFLQNDEVAVGIVGRIVPVKNHSFFLKAAAAIQSEAAKVRFFVIGDGALRKKLLHDCELQGLDCCFFPEDTRTAFVTFTSWITEVEAAMAGLDLIILTSWNEGTPVSLMEAQAAGKAVLSTKAGGIEDIIEDGVTGFIVQQGDLSDFSDKLKELINNTGLREKMGAAGERFASEHFQKQRQVNDLNELYRKLLSVKG